MSNNIHSVLVLEGGECIIYGITPCHWCIDCYEGWL